MIGRLLWDLGLAAAGPGTGVESVKIHLYILRQLLVAFLFAVGALLFIALPGIAVNTVHKLPNVDAAILLQFLPLVLQSLAPYVLPLCFMLSVVAVFGRLAADKEWIAIHMAGIHPLTVLIAPAAVATVLGLVTFWMVSNELPLLKKRQKHLLLDATASVIENLKPGSTRLQVGDFVMIAGHRDENSGVFSEAFLQLPQGRDKEGTAIAIFARHLEMSVVDDFILDVKVEDIQVFDPSKNSLGNGRSLQPRISLKDQFRQKSYEYDKAKYLVSREIRSRIRAGIGGYKKAEAGDDASLPEGEPQPYPLTDRRLREFSFMLHYRGSMFAIFYLFLGLGSATGLLMRRGTQLGALAVAAGYGILYYVLSMRVGKELGKSDVMPPWFGAWITTIVGGVIAVMLLRRAMRR